MTNGPRQTTVMRMTTSDTDLALAAAGGDGAAFAALLTRRYDGLFRLAFRLTGSQHEAEDLTQDICAALPAKLRAYRGDAQFTTWLYRVVVNAAHDRRRRRATQPCHCLRTNELHRLLEGRRLGYVRSWKNTR